MSKLATATVSSQRKSMLKKYPTRDSSGGDRLSDDEAHRRQPSYTLSDKEKQRKASNVNELRKTSNQLGILRDILFNARDIDKMMQKSSGTLQTSKSDRFIPRTTATRTGKNQFAKKGATTNASSRPTSAKSVSLAGVTERILQSEDDQLSSNSADDDDRNEASFRLGRSNRRNSQFQAVTRSASLYSQTRQQPSNARSMNNVSFISDASKVDAKLTTHTSSSQLKKLLDLLWLEFDDLESMTGFPSDRNTTSNTCSTALVMALLTLTGHVKEVLSHRRRGRHDVKNVKDQLSVVIKNQLDFQRKIETQMNTLQTMMQTVCQLVNSEIISNRKSDVPSISQPMTTFHHSPPQQQTSRLYRDPTDSELVDSRNHWSSHVPKSTFAPKSMSNAMDELLTFAERMNSDPPIESTLSRQPVFNRHSTYAETVEASKRLTRPTSAVSTNETQTYDTSKPTQARRYVDQDSRSSMQSPIDMPSTYDLFESGLPTSNSSTSILRPAGNGSARPSISTKETLLEKILQERLRLVQQMADLNKQHELAQDEIVTFETKANQSRSS